jgi:HK97 gp10 family phage protein
MNTSVKVSGLKELNVFLDTLPDKLQKNVMRAALRAGAKVIADQARENVPVASGKLKKDITIGTRSRGGVVTASVKAGAKSAWYAKFVEFGTAAHEINAKPGSVMMFNGQIAIRVNHPGAKPQPFMRPALDARGQAAVQAVAEKMREVLATKHGLSVPHRMEDGDE